MRKAERYIKKYLDDSEGQLLIQYDRWLQTIFNTIAPGGSPVVRSEVEIHQFHLSQPASLSRILAQHAIKVMDTGRIHGDEDSKSLQRKHQVKLSELPVIDINREFSPEEAIDVLRRRELKLAGDVESGIVAAIKQILLELLVDGNIKSAQSSIANLLDHNRRRASMIITTETTYAYNRGRLISYRENSVDYVRFSAIMDARTSEVCKSRHGKVMRMDDPELGANTPPLHGRCRSVLTPIYSRYEPDLIDNQNTNWSGVEPISKGWRTS